MKRISPMKNFSSHISKTFLALFFVGILFMGGVVSAQTGSPQGPGQPMVCRDGYRNWSLFISAAIGYGDFDEYWKDILERYNNNICHYEDIDSLLQRLDSVQKQIRLAFYACADTTTLEKRYHELEAEIFFLRNFIETDHGQILVAQDGDLLRMMREEFNEKRNIFSVEEVGALFEQFKNKYGVRLAAYENCQDPSWQSLVDKWNEFKESAGGIGPALRQAKQSFEKKWDRMANTSMNLGRSFIGGFVEAKLNGLPVKEGLYEIMEELKRNLPAGYNFEQLQVAQTSSASTYDHERLKAGYLVQYQTLYLETSDELTKALVERMALLNDIIQSTYQYQNQTVQCTKSINDRQC